MSLVVICFKKCAVDKVQLFLMRMGCGTGSVDRKINHYISIYYMKNPNLPLATKILLITFRS